MRFAGRVTRRRVAVGSKSEREAVVLEADDGAVWVLRRRGGHAYSDPELERLVGKRCWVDGELTGTTLVADGWEPAGEEP